VTGDRIERRRFLVATVALGAVSTVSGCAGDGADGATSGDEVEAQGGLPAGIAAIGSGYLDANKSLTEAALLKELPAGVDTAANTPEILRAMADIPQLVAIKEASFDVGQTLQTIEVARSLPHPIGVLTGSVVLLADLIRLLEMPLRVGLVQAKSYRGASTVRTQPLAVPE